MNAGNRVDWELVEENSFPTVEKSRRGVERGQREDSDDCVQSFCGMKTEGGLTCRNLYGMYIVG